MRVQRKTIDPSMRRALLPLLFAFSLAGCSRAPSVDILGSFFPAWLLCLTTSVVVTVFVQLLLSRLRMRVAYPVLFFPSLATLLTLALWLIFFH